MSVYTKALKKENQKLKKEVAELKALIDAIPKWESDVSDATLRQALEVAQTRSKVCSD